jgi:hypothetical protein
MTGFGAERQVSARTQRDLWREEGVPACNRDGIVERIMIAAPVDLVDQTLAPVHKTSLGI